MVVGRLAIQDHGMQQRAHVLSVIVELKNRSGHALEMEFDPQDLRIELFNSDGGRIEEDAAQVRSGPVTISKSNHWTKSFALKRYHKTRNRTLGI